MVGSFGDEIRVIIVEGTSDEGAQIPWVTEKLIRPKERIFKKLIGEGEISTYNLSALWPGHAMRHLDLGLPGQGRRHPQLHDWGLSTPDGAIDEIFRGTAVIYGVERSELASAKLLVEQVRDAVVELE
jgi:hypothetical protein